LTARRGVRPPGGPSAPAGTTTPDDDLDAVDDWEERTITADLLVDLCTREGISHSRVWGVPRALVLR
jgi:hypothetical protein